MNTSNFCPTLCVYRQPNHTPADLAILILNRNFSLVRRNVCYVVVFNIKLYYFFVFGKLAMKSIGTPCTAHVHRKHTFYMPVLFHLDCIFFKINYNY